MAAYDDLNVKGIFTVGVISVVVVAVTALAVQVVSYSWLQLQTEQKSAESDYRRQNEVLALQSEQISNYGVDPQTGNITIPIDQAIDLVAEEAAQRKPDGEAPNPEI
jgi:uncharacterized protein HemX